MIEITLLHDASVYIYNTHISDNTKAIMNINKMSITIIEGDSPNALGRPQPQPKPKPKPKPPPSPNGREYQNHLELLLDTLASPKNPPIDPNGGYKPVRRINQAHSMVEILQCF